MILRRGDVGCRFRIAPGKRHSRRRSGLTLLEVILASGLMVTLLGMVYWFYDSSLKAREEGMVRTRDVQLARVILDRMTEEIRQTVGNMPGYGPGLFGMKHSLSVNTLVLPDQIVARRRGLTDSKVAGQFDLQEVRYYIAWDEENPDEEGRPRCLGLVRRVTKTFNQTKIQGASEDAEEASEDAESVAVKEELYAPEIKFVDFRFFDGASWWEDWQLSQGNSLPMIVRVTVGYSPLYPEEEEQLELLEDNFLRDEDLREALEDDKYTVFVRLIQSDANPIGTRLQREASAFSASDGGI